MSTLPTPTSASLYQIPSASASSSRRTSLDTNTRSSTVGSPALQPWTGPPANQPLQARRNRAALRDYYGLKDAPAQHPGKSKEKEDTQVALSGETQVSTSELDAPELDAQAYVKGVLEHEGLEGVLRTEGGLVGEIKSLDGDRKALVYDNYSKLITATDTIRRMRANMDPLAPTTSTLAPAISHIAGTAEGLAVMMKENVASHRVKDNRDRSPTDKEKGAKTLSAGSSANKKDKREGDLATVKWVTTASIRYRDLIGRGEEEAAQQDWADVKRLLEKWRGKSVAGTQEVFRECEAALRTTISD
ncbi:hypothetical protein MMC10_007931 [Thelotrema lepadinum]|nr:hypothetical protein [Thelotrema lepadinum]